MRTLATLMMFLAAPLVGASDFDAQVALELAKARRLSADSSKFKTTTTCSCGTTNRCTCWEGQCACSACKLGQQDPAVRGGTAKSPKVQGSPTTRATPVQAADIPRQPVKELGLSEATPPAVTYTLVPTAGQAGFTSGGCANGQCPSSTSRRRLMSR